MARKERRLPYVSSFVDRHGKRHYRFRRKGFDGGYFRYPPGTAEHDEEHKAFMAQAKATPDAVKRLIPGSVADLHRIYIRSTDFRGNAAAVSIAKREAVLDVFVTRNRDKLVRNAPYDKLDAYIAKIAAGEIGKGGPFAAETARKVLTRFFAYAVKLGWRTDNPMAFVTYRPKKTSGFHSWTEAEIAQYRAHWPLGTKQRLALELMLWTGKRRGDAVGMGPQHIAGNSLFGRDEKTGKEWFLPIAKQLRQAIEAMPGRAHLCFIPSERGRAYSKASFGNAFRDWCDAAGLPHCTAHGLRKAIGRRMADLNMGNATLKSVTLHSRDDEVAIYTAAADQKRLSVQAIGAVSDWEMSNLADDEVSNHSAEVQK